MMTVPHTEVMGRPVRGSMRNQRPDKGTALSRL